MCTPSHASKHTLLGSLMPLRIQGFFTATVSAPFCCLCAPPLLQCSLPRNCSSSWRISASLFLGNSEHFFPGNISLATSTQRIPVSHCLCYRCCCSIYKLAVPKRYVTYLEIAAFPRVSYKNNLCLKHSKECHAHSTDMLHFQVWPFCGERE